MLVIWVVNVSLENSRLGLIITNHTFIFIKHFPPKTEWEKIVLDVSFLNVSLGFKVLVCSL